MRIAFVSIHDARSTRSGFTRVNSVNYYMARSLAEAGAEVIHLGPLHDRWEIFNVARERYYRHFHGKLFNRHRQIGTCRRYGRQLERLIAESGADLVLSGLSQGSQPLAYVDCRQPLVVWTDSALACTIGYYNELNAERSVWSNLEQGLVNEAELMKRVSLLLYSTNWGREGAVRHYGLPQHMAKVALYAANFDQIHTAEDIMAAIAARPRDVCRILFVGLDWVRKGGDIVLQTVEMLNQRGLPTQLHIVGCTPPREVLPPWVTLHGVIGRDTPENVHRLERLFAEAHFLFTPSRAEAFGHVFSEANAFGVPAITTRVGGLPEVIIDDLNGRLFPLDATIESYADYIESVFRDRGRYERMAQASYGEYATRLNWGAAGRRAYTLLQQFMASHVPEGVEQRASA